MSPKEKAPKPSRLIQAAVRVPQSVVDEYEAIAEEINKAAGWEKVSKSTLMRDDLLSALALRRTGDLPNLKEAIDFLRSRGEVNDAAVETARRMAKHQGEMSVPGWIMVLHDLTAVDKTSAKKR